MPEPAPSPQPNSSGTFASLFANLTSAKKANDAWDDSALLDDVSTISYEQALRAHRRVRTTVPADVAKPPTSAPPMHAESTPHSGSKQRKTATITIRLTESEQAQLHERAAAAQLSVSAYLRSCIFEAESLRAQVKEALAQIHATAVPDNEPAPTAKPSSRFNIWAKLRPAPRKV